MTVRGVIFDLDGTLADTLRTIAAALNDGLAALDLPEHEVGAVAGMVGAGVQVLCRKALPDGREDRLPALMLAVRAAYDREPLRHCRLYPGVEELLAHLASRGAALGVLSNKPHDLTVATVEGTGIAGRFRAVLGHREGAPHKPDPTSARWLLDELGLAPDETLYVGDTCIDVDTARAAGMRSVAVTWGFRTREELLACRPDELASEPREIAALYDRLARDRAG